MATASCPFSLSRCAITSRSQSAETDSPSRAVRLSSGTCLPKPCSGWTFFLTSREAYQHHNGAQPCHAGLAKRQACWHSGMYEAPRMLAGGARKLELRKGYRVLEGHQCFTVERSIPSSFCFGTRSLSLNAQKNRARAPVRNGPPNNSRTSPNSVPPGLILPGWFGACCSWPRFPKDLGMLKVTRPDPQPLTSDTCPTRNQTCSRHLANSKTVQQNQTSLDQGSSDYGNSQGVATHLLFEMAKGFCGIMWY